MLARQTTRAGGFLQRCADDAAKRVLHQLFVSDHVVGHSRPSLAPSRTLSGSFRAVNCSSTGRENTHVSNVGWRTRTTNCSFVSHCKNDAEDIHMFARNASGVVNNSPTVCVVKEKRCATHRTRANRDTCACTAESGLMRYGEKSPASVAGRRGAPPSDATQ